MPTIEATLKQNLAEVEERMVAACRRAGRQRSEVTLVAVTKYVSTDVARELLALQVGDLGESRPQELWQKAAAIPEATWHLVGHLQRNKIARTLPVVRLIHSVDSIRLLTALDAEGMKQGRSVNVLLEFNLSGEEQKHGFKPADAQAILSVLPQLKSVRLEGLMTLAAFVEDPEQTRGTFAALRELRANLATRLPAGCNMPHLSMGMTNDFEIAIEEGATLVRIGSALFRGVEGGSS